MAAEAPDQVKLTTLKELAKEEISDPKNTVVLTQTTLSILEIKEELAKLRQKYPELTIRSHICMATTARQKAVIKLAKKIGLAIIVGSPTSSNSLRLREAAEASGTKAYLVDTAQDLDSGWFKGVNKVAVSSGTSTPEDIFNEVINKIRALNP